MLMYMNNPINLVWLVHLLEYILLIFTFEILSFNHIPILFWHDHHQIVMKRMAYVVFRPPYRDFSVHYLTNVVISIINGIGIDLFTNITFNLAWVGEHFFIHSDGNGKLVWSGAKVCSTTENRKSNTVYCRGKLFNVIFLLLTWYGMR